MKTLEITLEDSIYSQLYKEVKMRGWNSLQEFLEPELKKLAEKLEQQTKTVTNKSWFYYLAAFGDVKGVKIWLGDIEAPLAEKAKRQYFFMRSIDNRIRNFQNWQGENVEIISMRGDEITQKDIVNAFCLTADIYINYPYDDPIRGNKWVDAALDYWETCAKVGFFQYYDDNFFTLLKNNHREIIKLLYSKASSEINKLKNNIEKFLDILLEEKKEGYNVDERIKWGQKRYIFLQKITEGDMP